MDVATMIDDVIRRFHLQTIDVIEAVEDRTRGVEPDQLTLRNCKFEVVSKNFQFFHVRNVPRAPEIVRHDKSPAPDVLSEVVDFFRIEIKEAWFREIEKGVIEDFGAIEPDDFVRLGRDPDASQ